MDEYAELKRALRLEPMREAVQREAGGLEFLDRSFVPVLERTLALTTELNFSMAGLQGMQANVGRCLLNRLRYQHDLARHPEILDEDVADPIVIIGLPRSGTTKLQRMLSAVPGVQPSHTWAMFNPAPFPGEGKGDSRQRIEWANAMARVVSASNPDFNRIHEYDALAADETIYIMLASFDYPLQWFGAPSPTYLEWARSIDRTSALSYLKAMLQYLQWQDSGRRGRPWVLKCPCHTGEIAEFLQLFPKAVFIMPRRDLAATMASSLQMFREVVRTSFPDIDLRDYGLGVLDYWSYELRRFFDQREQLGDRLRIIDATYQRVIADPVGIAREAFQLQGLPFTQAGEEAMRAWERDNPQNKFGKFHYDLADFGLTPADVGKAFGDIFEQWRGL